jgi:hypothetical protein
MPSFDDPRPYAKLAKDFATPAHCQDEDMVTRFPSVDATGTSTVDGGAR